MSTPPPDEVVELVPYDDTWAELYDRERFRIALAFGVLPKSGLVQHIGSTAVPGLLSRPVIDIMLGVSELPPPAALIGGLVRLGYENLGEAGVAKRVYLRLRGRRNFDAQIVRRGGTHWTNNLALRDHLCGDELARAKYAAAKLAALDIGARRLKGYTEAKAGFMQELVIAARGTLVR